MKRKKYVIRFIMSLLFFGAFYTTWTAITNVSANDFLKHSTSIFSTDLPSFQSHSLRDTALKKKSLNHQKAKAHYVSSQQIEGPKTLEEVVKMEQYPSVQVTATGYTAGFESTGKNPDHPLYGITFSGVKVKRDLYSTIAADLTIYPIGTILYIPDYGYGVVADKGGAIKGNKLDLYYPTVEDVFNKWGKKEVEVYIIKEGNGSLTEEELMKLNETEALQVFREQIQ